MMVKQKLLFCNVLANIFITMCLVPRFNMDIQPSMTIFRHVHAGSGGSS